MILCAWLLFKGVEIRGWCSLNLYECGEILAPRSQLLNAERQYNAIRMGLNQDNLMLGLSTEESGMQKMRAKMTDKHALLSIVLLTAD